MGYYVASTIDRSQIPAVCVLAKDTLNLLIFPFFADNDPEKLLVNAVCIPFVSILEEGQFHPSIMCILVSLFHPDKNRLNLSIPGEGQFRKRKLGHLLVE